MSPSSSFEAYAIGERYEEGLDERSRRLGAHFTPRDVAAMLVDRSLAAWRGSWPPVLCDPSCGGGVFLVAAADRLARSGVEPRRIVEELLVGADLDPGAVAASRAALVAWASSHGVDAVGVAPRVVVADALRDDLPGEGAIDLVVGNPPFQSQLGSDTARSVEERASLTERFGGSASGYVDVAALFQLRGLRLVRPGGVVTFIQPRSFLVARDAAPVRAEVLAAAAVRAVWCPGESVFDARVDVCATIVERGADPSPVVVIGGRDGSVLHGEVPAASLHRDTWSEVWATANAVPALASRPANPRTVGDVATATAGFRDQYYGMLDHLRAERPERGARVVTTAMVDPGRNHWAERTVRIARGSWIAPWLDLDGLAAADQRLASWVDRMLVPKVLVATQTRVIEAVADPVGDVVPMTPVIAVVAQSISPAHLEAALLAPAASVWALRRFGGAGMSAGALKLAARQVLDLPLPTAPGPWDEAVDLLGKRDDSGEPDWRAVGRALNASWEIDDDELVGWWVSRLPRPRKT